MTFNRVATTYWFAIKQTNRNCSSLLHLISSHHTSRHLMRGGKSAVATSYGHDKRNVVANVGNETNTEY